MVGEDGVVADLGSLVQVLKDRKKTHKSFSFPTKTLKNNNNLCVVKYHQRALPSQLQRDPLEVGGASGLLDQLPHLGRAGESNLK